MGRDLEWLDRVREKYCVPMAPEPLERSVWRPPVPLGARLEVPIEPVERQAMEKEARARFARNRRRGAMPLYGQELDQIPEDEMTGLVGELAVWKWRHPGEAYRATPEYDGQAGDVDGLGVRATRLIGGGLPLHDRDPDGRPFVLVLVPPPFTTATVAGWIMAQQGKRAEWLRREDQGMRYACYLVKQKELWPLYQLEHWLQAGVL